MSAPKIYLAGPMRGYEDFNFPAFDHATAQLRAAGYIVFSPAEHDRAEHGDGFNKSARGDLADLRPSGFSLRAALGADLAWICAEADGLAVLPGWELSAGATAEVAVARALSLRVDDIALWLRVAP